MSLIQRIRDKAAWIIFGAIALALLAFIVQDAFMRRGSFFGSGSTIGKVNGESIEHDDFQKKVEFYDQANGGQVERNQLTANVWDYLVNQTIMQQQVDKLGLALTSNERSDVLFGSNPPPWMQQAFTDPQTGLFDAVTAKKQFAAIKNEANDPKYATLNEYVDNAMMQRLGEKYQSLINGAAYVPKWMSEKMSADANSIAKASYVYVPYASISDSAVKVSDEEMEAYIKKNAERFKHEEETRSVSYVSFSAAPSKDDSLSVQTELNQLKNEFAATTDEKSFLNTKGSEAQYYNSLISGNEIKQAVKDTLFSLPPGAIYGPYLDGGNYVLAKMVAKQAIPDSAKVRHILVATHQRDQNSGNLLRIRDDSGAAKRLDSAIALIKNGASFDSVCIKYSDDPGSKVVGGVIDYFATGQMDDNFNDFSFTGKPGETKTVHSVFGYHYVEILGQRGSTTGYKIAYLSKPIVASSETDNAANNAAAQFAAQSRNDKNFEANAKKQGLTITASPEFKENDYAIPALGESRTLVKWAFEGKVGEVSQPENVGDKYVVAIITTINEKGLSSVQAVRQVVEPLVRNEKKAQTIIGQQMKGNTLEEYAKNARQQVQTVDSLSFRSFIVPGLDNEPQFIGAAFNKQIQGKVSSPIAGMKGVFVLKGEGISGVANMGQTAEMMRTQMEQALKQQMSQEVTALRKAADVKDYRSKFY